MVLAAASGRPTPDLYVIQGRAVSLPVEVRDASSVFASFIVPSAAMRALLPRAVHPAELWPGRGLCSIAAIEYRDNDLGRYNEVAIAFVVGDGDLAPRPFIDLVRGRVGAYIHRLPVNAAFTCEAGRTIWGFPKTLEDIRITEMDGRRVGALTMDGAHVLTLSAKSSGSRHIADAPFAAFSYCDAVLRRTPFVTGGDGAGYRLGGATLMLGAHPVADELRRLGLPKRPLMSGGIAKMHARFEAPQVIAGDARVRV